MNENLNTELIRRLLNRSLMQMDRPTLARLSEARQRALALHTESVGAAALAAGHSQFPLSHHTHHRLLHWGIALLLVAGLLSGIAYWQHTSEPSDDEVDVAILIDDLPVEMYAD
jgi:hypothetical protein